MIYKVDIKTISRVDFKDITRRVNEIVAKSGVINGICYIYVPHTTAGVMINEHADPDVVRDIEAQLDAMVPQHSGYRHREGNSPAHIKATLIGDSETLFVEEGRLVLGTWQGIFFAEFDGPRSRHIFIKITPD